MCDPATAGFVISAVATGASYFSGKAQAEAQQESIEANYQAQLADNAERLKELNSSAMTEKSDVAREALVRKGQIRVATGESGLGGLVTDSLLQDVDAQSGRAISRIEEDRRRGVSQISRNGASMYARNQSRMNQAQGPSAIQAGAQIGSNYFLMKANQPSTKSGTGSGSSGGGSGSGSSSSSRPSGNPLNNNFRRSIAPNWRR